LNQRLLSAGSDRSKNENRYDKKMYQGKIIVQPKSPMLSLFRRKSPQLPQSCWRIRSLADGVTPKAVVISPGTVSSLSRGFEHLKSIGRRKAHDVFEPMVTTLLRDVAFDRWLAERFLFEHRLHPSTQRDQKLRSSDRADQLRIKIMNAPAAVTPMAIMAAIAKSKYAVGTSSSSSTIWFPLTPLWPCAWTSRRDEADEDQKRASHI
jgi:hypothetical protein